MRRGLLAASLLGASAVAGLACGSPPPARYPSTNHCSKTEPGEDSDCDGLSWKECAKSPRCHAVTGPSACAGQVCTSDVRFKGCAANRDPLPDFCAKTRCVAGTCIEPEKRCVAADAAHPVFVRFDTTVGFGARVGEPQEVTLAIYNVTPTAQTIDPVPYTHSQLAVTILRTDETNREVGEVYQLPPPTPQVDPPTRTLAPGEVLRVRFPLAVDPPLPPGIYHLRVKGTPEESTSFEVCGA